MKLIITTDKILLHILGEMISVTHSVQHLAHRKCLVTISYQDCLLDLTASLEYHASPHQHLPRKVQANVMNMFEAVQLMLTFSVDCVCPIEADIMDWVELIGSEVNADLSGKNPFSPLGT